MELTVIASGSKGNCYLLHNDKEALMIEAGAPFRSVLAVLKGKVSKLVGCLVSHEHKDHAGYVKDVLDHSVPVYATSGTIEAMNVKGRYIDPVPVYGLRRLGGFDILPFETIHDAAEPSGFLLRHDECGEVLFVTDTAHIPYTFQGLSNIMIECNYDAGLLDARTDIPESLKERIRGSHMSLDTCIGALMANDLSKVNNIVLLHISEGDGDRERFTEEVKKATCKNVAAATRGLTIGFDRMPF